MDKKLLYKKAYRMLENSTPLKIRLWADMRAKKRHVIGIIRDAFITR
jgi:hypothetical protein